MWHNTKDEGQTMKLKELYQKFDRDVENGAIPMPTVAEVLAQMPVY